MVTGMRDEARQQKNKNKTKQNRNQLNIILRIMRSTGQLLDKKKHKMQRARHPQAGKLKGLLSPH